jgi:hypothetical protein
MGVGAQIAAPDECVFMSTRVCLLVDTLSCPKSGGLHWVYLNWALGLRALGCQLIWLERVGPNRPAHEAHAGVIDLKSRLDRYGLAESVALCTYTGEPLPGSMAQECLDFEAAVETDLLLNLAYGITPELMRRFRRSALLDIDPGYLQLWLSNGQTNIAPHDVYFTIGETVGQPGARFPDAGLKWQYTPPCVALDWWPPRQAEAGAPFTTVTHWSMNRWMKDAGGVYRDDKRTGFLPFLDLPGNTAQPLELALVLGRNEADERTALEERGWRLRNAYAVASTPWDYKRYVQNSFGEFSCAKPTYVRLETAWISDRTMCYLASGKPAVVQYTGASRFPDSGGLFRFRDMQEATRSLEKVVTDYERQCRLARALAEEHFDARKVVGRVLERALA